MEKKEIKVEVTFLEPVLGTSPANEEIYREFIGSKAPDAPSTEEEVAALGADGVIEKGMTIFPKDADGKPFAWDYQWKGFFKDACGMLSRVGGKGEDGKKKPAFESGKLKAYKKAIDGLIFVHPRQIPFQYGGEIGLCQRPLRAETMQGPRVCLAISEQIPAGAKMTFTVELWDPSLEPAVIEWLDYGLARGFGQWRNSGMGRFEAKIIEE